MALEYGLVGGVWWSMWGVWYGVQYMEYGGVSGGTMWGGVGGVYKVHGMGTWYEVSGVCEGTVWGGVGGIGGVWWIVSGGVSGVGTLGDYIFPPLHLWTIKSCEESIWT